MVSNVFIVVGLTYGDEGKGTTVDYLTRSQNASLIVRFNGGPQAAHFVVRDDGAVHCFAQFGAGSMAEGVKTFHSRYMLVEPFRMQNEATFLEDLGVTDPLRRIYLDLEAYVITPYHVLLNQLMEKQRGDSKHGSCGMGIGITAMEAFDNLRFYMKDEEPIHCLQVRDLLDSSVLKVKLENIIQQKKKQAQEIINETTSEHIQNILSTHLADYTKDLSVEQLVSDYENFVANIGADHIVDGKKFISQFLEKSENIVFEGAQGALLDTDFGFFPYNTATCCTPKNALTILSECTHPYNLLKVGILRTYSHRHGAGPFVAESTDAKFIASVPEQHNDNNLWQGPFRVGPLDFITIKYGLSLSKVDVISLTHMDYLSKNGNWDMVISYKYTDPNVSLDVLGEYFELSQKGADTVIHSIKPHKLSATLTHHISQCVPYEVVNLASLSGKGETNDYEAKLLDYIFEQTGVKVRFLSYGPRAMDKRLAP